MDEYQSEKQLASHPSSFAHHPTSPQQTGCDGNLRQTADSRSKWVFLRGFSICFSPWWRRGRGKRTAASGGNNCNMANCPCECVCVCVDVWVTGSEEVRPFCIAIMKSFTQFIV